MRLIKLFAVIVMGMFGLALVACSKPQPGTVYGMAVDNVYDTLKEAQLPKELKGKYPDAREYATSEDGKTRTMTWTEMLGISQLRITIKPEGDAATRVIVEVIPDPKVATALSGQETAMTQSLADEHVDSVLTGRAFNDKNVTDKLAAYELLHMGDIQGQALASMQESTSNHMSPAQDELLRRSKASMPQVATGQQISGQPMMGTTPEMMPPSQERTTNSSSTSDYSH